MYKKLFYAKQPRYEKMFIERKKKRLESLMRKEQQELENFMSRETRKSNIIRPKVFKHDNGGNSANARLQAPGYTRQVSLRNTSQIVTIPNRKLQHLQNKEELVKSSEESTPEKSEQS